MSPTVVALCAGTAIALLIWGILSKGQVAGRGNGQSIIALVLPSLAKYTNNPGAVTRKQKLILEAGSPQGLTPQTLSTKKLIGLIVGLMIALAAATIGIFPYLPLSAPLFAFLGWYYPTYKLNSARKKRMSVTSRELPEALDLLRVEMSTGDNIVPALKDVARRAPEGIIRDELQITVNDLAAGRTLAESLYGLRDRLPLQDVDSFVRAVLQAERLGADVGSTLAAQATATRASRESRIDKKIAGLASLLVVPLVANLMAVILILLSPPISKLLTFM